MRILFLLPLLFINLKIQAQPYLDLATIKYSKSPDAGLIRRNQQNAQFDNFNINLNLPIVFKKDSSAFVVSPFAELWKLKIDNYSSLPDQYQSFGLQLSYIKPLSQKWTITFVMIPRWNGYDSHWFDDNFQMGGAVIATYKKNATLKYKFGIYYNSEFTGPFFMPLLGIDWKVNSRNNIFGVLPGNLTWEHKVTGRFYYGAIFKAITNSYRSGLLNNKSYFMRVDDNQLTIYSDIYLAKKIVFTLEGGHSVLRQIRFGYKGGAEKYFYKDKINDDWIFKASFAYRLRF